MNNAERDEFDKKVYAYFKVKGTLSPSDVAHHFNKKWETAHNSIRRLVEKGMIFYHPEISRSPMCYSVWRDFGDDFKQRYFEPTQTSKNGNETGNSTSTTFVPSLSEGGIVRGRVGETIEKVGFVYHPSARGKDVPRTFVRGHLHGQYFVDIKTAGRMPETYAIPDMEVTGGWTKRKMKGNDCFYGHISFPDDTKKFNFHCMSDKDGNLKGLSVYVHPRYIYYRHNERTAAGEFRQQVKDVLGILQMYGWEFGAIYAKGTYSMAINDPILASHVPTAHVESNKDSVIYDSSPMAGDGVCTEAEILANHPSAEAEVELMVELPQRIWSLEAQGRGLEEKITSLHTSVDRMADLLSVTIPHMENLTKTVKDLSIVTEFNSSVIFGTTHPMSPEQPYIAKLESKGDAMYG